MAIPPPRLPASAVDAALLLHPGWQRVDEQLGVAYRFASFAAAVAFTQRVAAIAEAQQHHPEWTVRYRVVALRTTTHDAGGLTQRDLDLLVAITALATASGATPIVAS